MTTFNLHIIMATGTTHRILLDVDTGLVEQYSDMEAIEFAFHTVAEVLNAGGIFRKQSPPSKPVFIWLDKGSVESIDINR